MDGDRPTDEDNPFAGIEDTRTPTEKKRDAERANWELRKQSAKATAKEAAKEAGLSLAYVAGTVAAVLIGGAILGVIAAVLIGQYVYIAALVGMFLGRVFFEAWWTHPPPPPAPKREREPSEAAKGCPKCGFTHKWDGTTCGHCGHGAAD